MLIRRPNKEISPYVVVGPTMPKAGPTLLKQAAITPMESMRDSPVRDNRIVNTMNTRIYKQKKPI
ncbi:MAG: hypothetical protein LUD41_00945, partial [Phascolarctobacterium sp.]|nr:hypothetical protein [Phascolarctobacterium sp.]